MLSPAPVSMPAPGPWPASQPLVYLGQQQQQLVEPVVQIPQVQCAQADKRSRGARQRTIRYLCRYPVADHHAGAEPQRQFIPMSVNHHSSLNIVYAPGAPIQQELFGQSDQVCEQPRIRPKQSSLGASMRRTVKLFLNNKSHFRCSANNNRNEAAKSPEDSQQAPLRQRATPPPGLKSALKSSQGRDLVLNSEGSDGDGSTSSDSTTTIIGAGSPAKPVAKSTVGKQTSGKQDRTLASSGSSDSSLTSSCSSAKNCQTGGTRVAKRELERLKQDIFEAHTVTIGNDDANTNWSQFKAAQAQSAGPTSRKNVTFSTKLTSIL